MKKRWTKEWKRRREKRLRTPRDNANKEVVCVSEKEIRDGIISLFMEHLEYHPFVHRPPTAEPVTSKEELHLDLKDTWKSQVQEMHNLCRKHGESWAWEYLYKNWYHPDKYIVWARSIFNEIPIINSNAIVESVWSVLKKNYLRKHKRPKLEFLIDIITNQYLPNLIGLVGEHRNFISNDKPTW